VSKTNRTKSRSNLVPASEGVYGPNSVIPAKAGIQVRARPWTPAQNHRGDSVRGAWSISPPNWWMAA